MADAKKDKLQIRNSTVDFLVFTKDAHEDGIEVRVQDCLLYTSILEQQNRAVGVRLGTASPPSVRFCTPVLCTSRRFSGRFYTLT